MGKAFSEKKLALYRSVDEILHYIWDPIGVAGSAYARDEYQAYLPNVFKLLIDDSSEAIIVDKLLDIATTRIGLSNSPELENSCKAVAEILSQHREKYKDSL